uniref:Uncharacterized protein n=1 Tax=Pararge aegeria TaxID=116150 RepID=S4PVU6_9NEOP
MSMSINIINLSNGVQSYLIKPYKLSKSFKMAVCAVSDVCGPARFQFCTPRNAHAFSDLTYVCDHYSCMYRITFGRVKQIYDIVHSLR